MGRRTPWHCRLSCSPLIFLPRLGLARSGPRASSRRCSASPCGNRSRFTTLRISISTARCVAPTTTQSSSRCCNIWTLYSPSRNTHAERSSLGPAWTPIAWSPSTTASALLSRKPVRSWILGAPTSSMSGTVVLTKTFADFWARLPQAACRPEDFCSPSQEKRKLPCKSRRAHSASSAIFDSSARFLSRCCQQPIVEPTPSRSYRSMRFRIPDRRGDGLWRARADVESVVHA